MEFDYGRPSNWSLEDGYKSSDVDVYPRRALGAGVTSRMEVSLFTEKLDYDFFCHGPYRGFEIYLHSPAEVPSFSKNVILLNSKKVVKIKVKPSVMTTSKELKKYAPSVRQCYFNDERYLKYFKVYTQNNCELECLSNYTLHECGCLKFWMPRDNSTRICNYNEWECGVKAENDMLKKSMSGAIAAGDTENITNCNCLPSCFYIDYDTEISQIIRDSADMKEFLTVMKTEEFATRVSIRDFSLFTITLKDKQVIPSKRSELYGFVDFLANCGGILGFLDLE